MYDMSNDIPTDLLSARGLADELGVTSATVRRWVRTKRLVPTEITYGGYYRFDLEDAKRQLDGQRFVRPRDYRKTVTETATPEDHSQALFDTEE